MKIEYLKPIITFLIVAYMILASSSTIEAQRLVPMSTGQQASPSSEATQSAQRDATASSIVKRVVEKSPDLTQPEPEVKGKLERYLEENPVGPLSPFNVVRHAIRYAVSQGVPPNTLVLTLLFPLIATVVVFARHIIGLKSFGIFTPALLSVAFLTTGLTTGIALFTLIMTVATLVRMLLRKIRIQYLPRMAMFMLFISLSIFSTLLISPALGNKELITIGIFPILILILLAEDFLDLQITRSFSQAIIITVETIVLAIACYYLMNWETLQKFTLVHPEAFILGLLVSIVIIEQYAGLRLLEIWRFRKLLK